MHHATPYEQAKANMVAGYRLKDARIADLESENRRLSELVDQHRARAHKLANDAQAMYLSGYEDGVASVKG
jgi:hypothetical protein